MELREPQSRENMHRHRDIIAIVELGARWVSGVLLLVRHRIAKLPVMMLHRRSVVSHRTAAKLQQVYIVARNRFSQRDYGGHLCGV